VIKEIDIQKDTGGTSKMRQDGICALRPEGHRFE